MKNILLTTICFVSFLHSCKEAQKQKTTEEIIAATEAIDPKTQKNTSFIKIWPIQHATMVLEYHNKTIYVDPIGGASSYANHKKPDIILITDVHGDHMNPKTLSQLDTENSTIIVPKAVAEKLSEEFNEKLTILDNGATITLLDITIEAIPMYNLREEALKFHQKGRGNGYVLTLGKERVYISGDTEDIPEMRALKNIDIAFICMNLPYTMTVTSAANAVLEFKPKKVYPYHYRGTEGLSDVALFKELVNKGNAAIDVVQLDWYPEN